MKPDKNIKSGQENYGTSKIVFGKCKTRNIMMRKMSLEKTHNPVIRNASSLKIPALGGACIKKLPSSHGVPI